jgi:nucleoside-diphosphate-sugar epimerase
MNVLVTGGNGFLGQHVVHELDARDHVVYAPRSSLFDLRRRGDVAAMLRTFDPDVVVHLAARVGGIGENVAYPGQLFYENAIMGVELMEQARRARVKKFLTIGTGCAYPEHCPTPEPEGAFWDGYPSGATAPYAMAKKMMLVQGQAYREEYDFNAVYVIPPNLYGPGDNFDLESGHVVPAIIRKVSEAKRTGDANAELWGTGRATRDFLYITDAAKGICDALDFYNSGEPVNLGSGRETSIAELAQIVADVYEWDGDFTWNSRRPDGQPRRLLDISRALQQFAWRPEVALEDGVRATIDWWESR